MFAADIFELISLGVERKDLGYGEHWEMINSRAGQYLNSYLDDDISMLPDHVKKEVLLMRA